MAIADGLESRAKANPRVVTAVVSTVGYALVIGVFLGLVPLPELSDERVLLFADLIAVINTIALGSLLAGWWFIRQNQVRNHRAAMLTAFVLILLFLLLYLWKVGGGFRKEFVVPASAPLAGLAGFVKGSYLAMLAVHILLSVVSVPVVVHAVTLGLTHSPTELTHTSHARVGRIAVVAWSLSLFLGVITYLLLNHVYAWERAAGVLLLPLL